MRASVKWTVATLTALHRGAMRRPQRLRIDQPERVNATMWCAPLSVGRSAYGNTASPAVSTTSALDHVVATLDAVGPCPLSKLSTSLSEDVAEQLAQGPGGFSSFCQRSRHAMAVVFVDGARKTQPKVPVAIPQKRLHRVQPDELELVTFVVGLLAVAKWARRNSVLTEPEPLASDVLSAVHRSSLPAPIRLQLRDGLSAMQSLVRRNPQLLAFDVGGKRLRLVTTRKAPSAGDDRSPHSWSGHEWSRHRGSVGQLASTRPFLSPWQRFVLQCVPSSFFVPASFVTSHGGFHAAMGQSQAHDEQQVMTRLAESAERGDIQLVTLTPPASASTPSPLQSTYVRALWASQSSVKNTLSEPVTPPGLMSAPDYATEAALLDSLSLSQAVAAAVAAYEKQNVNLNRLRLIKGLSAEAIVDVLPASLRARLSESLNATVRDEACATVGVTSEKQIGERAILLLDRMRHLFDVDLGAMRVRPWSVLPVEDLPSSLTWQTSPSPPLLLAMQGHLQRSGPQPASHIAGALADVLLVRLLALYDMNLSVPVGLSGTPAHCATLAGLLESVPMTTKADACRLFLSQHSLYFTEVDGLFYTPEVLAKERRTAATRARYGSRMTDPEAQGDVSPDATDLEALTEKEFAERLSAALPSDVAVCWTAASLSLLAHGFRPSHLTVDLLSRYSHLFSIHEPFLGGLPAVGQHRASAPSPELLQPPLDNLDDIIKYVAIKACGGASENIIMQSFPARTRSFLKSRVGSVTSLVEQLPQWFSVCRDVHNEGASIITYIGASGEPEASHEALRPMRNVGHRTWRHEPLDDGFDQR